MLEQAAVPTPPLVRIQELTHQPVSSIHHAGTEDGLQCNELTFLGRSQSEGADKLSCNLSEATLKVAVDIKAQPAF